jgi:hypothetical protein
MKLYIFQVNDHSSVIGIVSPNLMEAASKLPSWVETWDADVTETDLMFHVDPGLLFYIGGVG